MKVWKILYYVILVSLIPACQNDLAEQALADHLEDYEPPELQWQILLQKGEAIPTYFDDVKRAAEGLIPVNTLGLWGYIDMTGHKVIHEKYIEAHPFGEGLARVRAANGLFGFINKAGEFVIPPTYVEAGDVHHGFICVSHSSGYAFIDVYERVLGRQVFSRASDYKNAMAKVKLSSGWQLIDTFGQVSPESYDQILIGEKGDPIVVQINNQWTYLFTDTSLATTYDYAEPFFGNQALVKTQDEWHLIDPKEETIASSSNLLLNLGKGCYSIIRADGHQVFLNNKKSGLDAIPEIHRMHDGYMVYRQNGYWNWLNTSGHSLLEKPVDLAWDFNNGLAKFGRSTGIGVIDTSGHVRLSPFYADVRILHPDGIYAVQSY